MSVFEYTHNAESLESSSIDAVWWDSKTQRMIVRFVRGGYAGYKDISLRTVIRFINAVSIGRYFYYNIKGGDGFNVPADIEMRRRSEDTEDSGEETLNAYTVKGYVKVEERINGTSVEDAIRRFREVHDDTGQVTEVVVHFE